MGYRKGRKSCAFSHQAAIGAALALLGCLGCGQERLLAVLDDTDAAVDTADTDSAFEACQDAVRIADAGVFQGQLAVANRFELATNNQVCVDTGDVTSGPDEIWELYFPPSTVLDITFNQWSLTGAGADCPIAAYIVSGCKPNTEAVCPSQNSVCVGDPTCLSLASANDADAELSLNSLNFTEAVGTYWLIVDTNSMCGGTYSFQISKRVGR
jgi:hypothetical protein